jgi:cytochrome c556
MKAVLPLAALAVVLAGCADNSPGGKAAQTRHENFEQIGEAFDTISDEVKEASPDMAEVRNAADRLAVLAPQVPEWFPAGSGPQDGKSTEALEEAWTRPEELRLAADRFAAAVTELKAAAEAGDQAALGAAVKTVGGACKNCHDKFKED